MFRPIAVAFFCTAVLTSCSEPTVTATSPQGSGTAQGSPPAPATSPDTGTCDPGSIRWTSVEHTDALAALGDRRDLAGGDQTELNLQPTLTGALVSVDADGLDGETVLDSLDERLPAATGLSGITVARPGDPILGDPAFAYSVAPESAGTYVGYKAVGVVDATFTYTCTTGGPVQQGAVTTWFDKVSGAVDCADAETGELTEVEKSAAAQRC